MLQQHGVEPRSLRPRRRVATSFATLGEVVAQTPQAAPFLPFYADTLGSIVEAVLDNFPKNIFWDFDFLVANMLQQASVATQGADHFLHEFNGKMVSLMQLFGNQSSIRFRYLHDFMYGFDWAKWVQKEPQSRGHVAPFDLEFLDYLLGRGQEILQLIAERDRKYHPLGDDSYRNPFGFSREPEDEAYLLVCLVQRKFIPVTTWEYEALPVWNKPFHRTREEISQKLYPLRVER